MENMVIAMLVVGVMATHIELGVTLDLLPFDLNNTIRFAFISFNANLRVRDVLIVLFILSMVVVFSLHQ